MVATLREVVRRMSNKSRKISVSERPPPTPIRCELPNCPHRQPGTPYHFHPAAEELAQAPLSGHKPQPTTRPPTRPPTRAASEADDSEAPNIISGKGRKRALTRVMTGARNLVRRLTTPTPTVSAKDIGAPTNFEHLHHEEAYPTVRPSQTSPIIKQTRTNSQPDTSKRGQGTSAGLVRSTARAGRLVQEAKERKGG